MFEAYQKVINPTVNSLPETETFIVKVSNVNGGNLISASFSFFCVFSLLREENGVEKL